MDNKACSRQGNAATGTWRVLAGVDRRICQVTAFIFPVTTFLKYLAGWAHTAVYKYPSNLWHKTTEQWAVTVNLLWDQREVASNQSTFCATMMSHCQATNRKVHLVNLDPAAENFEYEPTIDIRDLITLEDVMEELDYGPNGGLIYCLEFLLNNMDWLEEELGDYEDDYLIFDCPGQIELYTHFPIMRRICEALQRWNFAVCGVYCLESQFIEDKSKYFSGVLSAMSAMINMEIPHINVMTKMDLVEGDYGNQPATADEDDGGGNNKDGRKKQAKRSARSKTKKELERYFDPDPLLLIEDVNNSTSSRFHALNQSIVQLIEDYNMVSFIPLNIRDDDSINYVLSNIDNAIQYGEDIEPKEPDDMVEYDDNDE